MKEYTKKKICFALLVHENRELVEQLIANINYYCPNSHIVLYNGGNKPNLCEELGVQVCPTSKKLKYGNLSSYFFETMEWLDEINLNYDYFINLDSDVLFFRKGYEEFIEEQMKDADYMGVKLRIPDKNWTCGKSFKKDIQRWEPFFCTKPFWGVFNVGQVMSKELVKALLEYEKLISLKNALEETDVFGIEEIIFTNLANELGFKMKSYPDDCGEKLIRYRPHFKVKELSKCLSKKVGWLAHPIHRTKWDPAREFIYELQSRNINDQKSLIDKNNKNKRQSYSFKNYKSKKGNA
ncbi:hypothetical protein H1D32_23235 [Anaerobacillus sp. CMMVII]|uniref:hypothetical protein n=1 Tax=Anaerobacillus sp. CMMVII TaxID=2755588 RepID=UPI0021B7AA67|nr:hypothetical protein [Anaerobacillus sp. CMMVII]MCT8140355.1 hypothetical protein [Anaerobacillus sp. CMMVII]